MRKHYPLLAMLVVAGIMFCIPKGENRTVAKKVVIGLPITDTAGMLKQIK